jgi:hypothetical protein
LVAGREKDHAFAAALIRHKLVDPTVIAERIDMLAVTPAQRRRLKQWIEAWLS